MLAVRRQSKSAQDFSYRDDIDYRLWRRLIEQLSSSKCNFPPPVWPPPVNKQSQANVVVLSVHVQCARSVLVAICALVTEKMRQNASKVHGVHGVNTRALFFRTQLAGALLITFSVIFEHFKTFLGR